MALELKGRSLPKKKKVEKHRIVFISITKSGKQKLKEWNVFQLLFFFAVTFTVLNKAKLESLAVVNLLAISIFLVVELMSLVAVLRQPQIATLVLKTLPYATQLIEKEIFFGNHQIKNEFGIERIWSFPCT